MLVGMHVSRVTQKLRTELNATLNWDKSVKFLHPLPPGKVASLLHTCTVLTAIASLIFLFHLFLDCVSCWDKPKLFISFKQSHKVLLRWSLFIQSHQVFLWLSLSTQSHQVLLRWSLSTVPSSLTHMIRLYTVPSSLPQMIPLYTVPPSLPQMIPLYTVPSSLTHMIPLYTVASILPQMIPLYTVPSSLTHMIPSTQSHQVFLRWSLSTQSHQVLLIWSRLHSPTKSYSDFPFLFHRRPPSHGSQHHPYILHGQTILIYLSWLPNWLITVPTVLWFLYFFSFLQCIQLGILVSVLSTFPPCFFFARSRCHRCDLIMKLKNNESVNFNCKYKWKMFS